MNTNTPYLSTLLDGILETNQIQNIIIHNNARVIAGETVSIKPKLQGLYSVLQSVGSSQNDYRKDLKKAFKISPLNIKDDVFPSDMNEQAIEGLLKNFKESYDKLVAKSFDEKALNYSIYHLLYKYGTRVAFPLVEDVTKLHELRTDVSLFDRNRIIASIVKCNEFRKLDKTKPFLLVKGDLSGIQKFIYYDIADAVTESGGGKKIAKKLRGRSFFIALFTEFIAEHFIEELGLEQANLIFAGGGHFNLVLPNTDEIRTKLEALEKEMNLFIRNKVGSSISLILASVECEKELFTNTSKYFSDVNHRLEAVKQEKHKDYLSEVFYPTKKDGTAKRIKRKISLKSDVKLGQRLPSCQYLIELKFKPNTKPSDAGVLKPTISFDAFRKYIFIKGNNTIDDNKFIIDLLSEYENEIEFAKIIRVNNTDFIFSNRIEEKLSKYKFPIAFGFKLIGKYAPTQKNDKGILELKDFSEIAKINYDSAEDLSYSQLAAMRLDVDDLGAIFAFGLNKKVSFQRVASLSREFHLFFSGYFNELAEKYQVYIVYSGGDDAFVVGSWFNIVHFAKELHKQFKAFACDNKLIDFSAGVFLCHPTYPVARFANDAAKLEKRAKDYPEDRKNGEPATKNAIHIFDHTLTWANYDSMVDFGKLILRNTNVDGVKEKEKIARSMVHRLLRLIKSTINKNNRIDFNKLNKNAMMLHYLFARHGYTAEHIEKSTTELTQGVIKKILEDFSNDVKIRDYLVATSYVILKTRKIN